MKDIVIKKADEGSAVVLMPQEDYISKAMQHLDNDQEYRRLDEDHTEEFANEISSF